MFRTIAKDKIPHTHTYPIGLQAIGVMLGEEVSDLVVRFECYPTRLQSDGVPFRISTLTCGKPNVPFGANRADVHAGIFARS